MRFVAEKYSIEKTIEEIRLMRESCTNIFNDSQAVVNAGNADASLTLLPIVADVMMTLLDLACGMAGDSIAHHIELRDKEKKQASAVPEEEGST